MTQGVGSILGGPAAAWLHDATGNWMLVFGLVITMDIITALLALFVLKRMRHGFIGYGTTAPKLRAAE